MCGVLPMMMAKGKIPAAALGGVTGLAIDSLASRKPKRPYATPSIGDDVERRRRGEL